jgi:hypothetical protein
MAGEKEAALAAEPVDGPTMSASLNPPNLYCHFDLGEYDGTLV